MVDISTLQRVEQEYRQRLQQEPGDTNARLGLAWCLGLQALYEAGQERAVADLIATYDRPDDPTRQRLLATVEAPPERRARDLLRSCLEQTITIMHLSSDPQERSDVEKLRSLVRLTGGEREVLEADAAATRILREIALAITQSSTNGHDSRRQLPRST